MNASKTKLRFKDVRQGVTAWLAIPGERPRKLIFQSIPFVSPLTGNICARIKTRSISNRSGWKIRTTSLVSLGISCPYYDMDRLLHQVCGVRCFRKKKQAEDWAARPPSVRKVKREPKINFQNVPVRLYPHQRKMVEELRGMVASHFSHCESVWEHPIPRA